MAAATYPKRHAELLAVSEAQRPSQSKRHFGVDERLDVCVYGDTHVHRIDTLSGVLCVNPGSPTFPRNLSAQLGTVGYLDIEDGVATPSLWQFTPAGLEPTESWDYV